MERDLVARALADLYGLEGALEPLPGEWDQNFRLDAGPRGLFVVKVANGGHDDGVLDLQNAALEHLAASGLRLKAPGVVRAREGEATARFQDGLGADHRIRVLTWLDGEPLSMHRPLSRELLAGLGRALGELDLALAGFTHPAMNREIGWDLGRAAWISPWTGIIGDRRRRSLVERHLLDFRGRVRPRLDGLPVSVIHNDANDANVLLSRGPDGSLEVTGILDFGDMVRSHRVHEIAVACAYAVSPGVDPAWQAAVVAGGYHAASPLGREEIDLLLPLIRMRLCVSVVTSARAAVEDPGNLHRQSSDAPAWELLERLDRIPSLEERLVEGVLGGASPRERARRPRENGTSRLRRRRRELLGPSLSLAYSRPLTIMRGRGAWLYDGTGRPYLDCVNNVCHVGHCHPRVVEALSRQAAVLNTNTRYLHPAILDYAERLAATFPDPLGVCYFVNSGSEANELAIRLARAHTGRREALTLDRAYHGNTPTLVGVSPYKCEGPGGEGLPDWVTKAPSPDPYRGSHRGSGPETGAAYAREVEEACRRMERAGRPPALLICESIQGCGGQVVPPQGFLREAFATVREAGGVSIADEVQVGMGRVGSHMWAFEAQGALPDIVTLGKPMGNGHPLGAVITTREIAGSLPGGMEYFNTFGGNPVSMAVGSAVLDVIEEEGLMAHAAEVGRLLKDGLQSVARSYPWVGDVRGMGLFLGVELVEDPESREPAPDLAAHVVEEALSDGILLAADGPDRNVIKIKPPLSFSEDDARAVIWSVEKAIHGWKVKQRG